MSANSSPTSKTPGKTGAKMTVGDWLKSATQQLEQVGIGTARLDCLLLLEDALNTNRTQLLAHDDRALTSEQLGVLQQQLARRQNHQPLAYIRGKVEFYGRLFAVTPAVLVPRPETETMIDLLLTLSTQPANMLVDVGTGSGAIAVTAALELPNAKVLAVDIDPACLKVAQSNARALNANIEAIKSDLLSGVKLQSGAVVLANLPYVPDDYRINQAAQNEPHQAIFGGPDGLDLYRQLFKQLAGQNVVVLAESLPFQHPALSSIAQTHGFSLFRERDFIQAFKPTFR